MASTDAGWSAVFWGTNVLYVAILGAIWYVGWRMLLNQRRQERILPIPEGSAVWAKLGFAMLYEQVATVVQAYVFLGSFFQANMGWYQDGADINPIAVWFPVVMRFGFSMEFVW